MDGLPHERFERVLSSVQGQPLVVLLAGHPDPDAIGSALAHRRIGERLGVPVTVACVHPLAHRENRALVKLLGIEMTQIADANDLKRFKHLSLVDTQRPDPTLDLPADLNLLTVVDHHGPPAVDAPFVDVRPTIGASCSIYAQYLQHGLAPLGSARDDRRLATALFFGIQTDTDDFTLASADDFAAAAYVRPLCDLDVLKRVGRRAVSAVAMDVISRCLNNLQVVRDFAVAGAGEVAAADRDAIGAAADFLLRREDIDTAIVFGVVGDRIDGSLRTNNPSIDPQWLLETAFGRDAAGRPYGGGRADKGGFQIPLGIVADGSDRKALWALVQQVVRSRLARVVPELSEVRG